MAHVEDVLARYCEDVLPEAEARAVEAHLQECAACRVAEAEVRRGIAWAGAMEPVALPEPDAVRIRRQLVEGRPRSVPWRWAAAAAAVVVLAVGLAHGIRGPLTVEPAGGPPTRFEQAALDLHDRHAAGRLALDLRSSSVPEVRRWAEEHAGVSVNLAIARPAEDGDRFALEGAARVQAAGATALAVAYRVDGQPVTLLTANETDVPERAPEWALGGKRVRFRSIGTHKLLAWTNSGQTYALVSEPPGYGQQSCLLCHTTGARRDAIRALGEHPD